MSEELRSFLVGTTGLDLALLIALSLTLRRGGVSGADETLSRTVRIAVLVLALQAAHFAEELATGFHARFPELLGLTPWPRDWFVTFNVAWLAIWGVSILALASRSRASLFPVWFLGIAGASNAVAHPFFSLLTDAYFPGLATSPLVGVAAVFLLRNLVRTTRSPRDALRAA